MYQLDIRTIALANSLYAAVIPAFILIFGRRSFRRIPGLNWWAYGFLLITVNFLVISLRNFIPVTVSNILPHLSGLLGLLLIKEGLSRFYRSKPFRGFDAALFLLFFFGLILASDRGLHWRIPIIAVGGIFAYALTLLMLRGQPNAVSLRILYSVSILVQGVRLRLGLSLPDTVDPMEAGTPLAVISMLLFLSTIFIALSLVSITIRRLLREKEMLLDKERKNALTDELTGLMNRRGFKTVYDMEEKRGLRRKHLMSIVMADIDGFKAINDRYGHECGDGVLKYIAEVMRREFRGGDLLGRWGGEEFIVAQPDTDAESCRTSLERTRQAIARDPFHHGDEVFYVTVSFGFCTVKLGDMTFGDQLKRADDSMYAAKKGGRNRVIGGAV